ncbi:Transmembrane amino acid transporter protein [Phytophthora infestans]|uniref:Transmembrane amino acid transporter protein n=1 Tax=Phytophthora infestans TaxID=4787 RepID=A0A833WHG8_PHYIN|nr:Transmembrane amino acid transporter protein [Phytophthora infestans]
MCEACQFQANGRCASAVGAVTAEFSSSLRSNMFSPGSKDYDVRTPAFVHDIAEEGSDMTREIYSAALKDSHDGMVRTKSLPDVSEVLYKDVGKASDIAQPGGFRRDHVIANLPAGDNSPPIHVQNAFLASIKPNNLLQSTYCGFVNETLHLGDEYSQNEELIPLFSSLDTFHTETDATPTRGASVKQTIFTIFKSFIGSGILFLPKGFQNGGMLFSIVGLCVSAALSTFCMLRLVECSTVLLHTHNHLNVSYGIVGEQAFGTFGRRAVNVSLVLSQIGFCCSYLIFVEKNIGEVVLHAFNLQSSSTTSSWTLILLQIPLYTPLVWVRRLEYFAFTSLFADVLIVFGLVYILTYTAKTLESATPGESSWQYFNSENWAMFLGVAVYCFEGIGLVLPTYDAMDDQIKYKFPAILSWCVVCILVICILFAGTVYAAFGQNTQSVVTLNLPSSSESTGTMAVQLTYSLALVLSYPLMLYPVINILENKLFPYQRVKGFWRWQKNGFRFALVCLTAVIGYFGKNELDNFVSIIGGFCSVPLAFIYPCIFHSSLVGRGHILNGIVVVIGLSTMVFATNQAVSTWNW